MAKFSWDTRDRYRSNNGRGPLVARILSCTDTHITIEHWPEHNPGMTAQATLTLRFFLGPTCGWRCSPSDEEVRRG